MHAPNVLFNLFLLDLAFPIFEALKKHMIKSPSFSYYVLQAFKNWTWVTIFLRIVDAFTDITLTKTYFEDFDSVVNDFIGNTLSLQPGNSSCLDIACVKNQCLESEIWSHKLICTFPLMTWWISGTLSVVVLAITYFAEVISTIFSKKFDHFFLHCTVGFAAKSTIGEQSFSMPSFYHWASKWQVLSIVNGSKLLLLIGKTKTQRQLPTYHQKIMSALNIVKRTEQKVSL